MCQSDKQHCFITSLCIIYTNQQGHTSARNKKGMIRPVEHFKGEKKELKE